MGLGAGAGTGEQILPELEKGSWTLPGEAKLVIPEAWLEAGAQVMGPYIVIMFGGLQG